MPTRLLRLLDAAFGRPVDPSAASAARSWPGPTPRRSAGRSSAPGCPGKRVLVVGPGPGVGLAEAAVAVGPTGFIVGVEPSALMRRTAARRCAEQVAAGTVDLRDGTAEDTGCTHASVDVVLSVNNVMLVGPAGRLRRARPRPAPRRTARDLRAPAVLHVVPDRLRDDAAAAGFADVELTVRPRKRNSPAVELVARRPGS